MKLQVGYHPYGNNYYEAMPMISTTVYMMTCTARAMHGLYFILLIEHGLTEYPPILPLILWAQAYDAEDSDHIVN